MEMQQGYSYHIKDKFFDRIQDKYLMSNKENGNYRPHFYAKQDKKNQALNWRIPISLQVEKYKVIIEKKKESTENLREVLALHNRGINLIYTDIEKIKIIMEQELENTECQ